jgi:hypothetical protein
MAPTRASSGARALRMGSVRPKIRRPGPAPGPGPGGWASAAPGWVALLTASRTAVISSIAPNRYSTQPNRFSAAAPAAMNIPRSSRASRMPSSSTRLRSWGGTAERPISRTNTNRLSRDRLYSVSQPAKNCPDAREPATAPSSTPNSAPSATMPSV